MFSPLEAAFGKIPVATLFENPTVASLSAWLKQGNVKPRWKSLVSIHPAGTQPALFLIPGVHGNVLYCTKLAWALGHDQPLYGLHSVGLDGEDPTLEAIEGIAKHFISEIQDVQPHGPYYLAGMCMGGTVAYEIARQLREKGELVGALVMVETWMPKTVRTGPFASVAKLRPIRFLGHRVKQHIEVIRSLKPHERPSYFLHIGKLLKDAITNRKLHASLKSEIIEKGLQEANFSAMVRYNPRPYDGSLVLILADANPLDPAVDSRLGWAKLVSGTTQIYRMNGKNAGVLMREPLVDELAHLIRNSIQAGITSSDGQKQ